MLAITGMSAIGAGVARLASGKVIFTPFTIAGERVLVRVTKDRRDYAEGELVRVVEPSPARVDPRCEHFGECGGCQYQHMSMEEQARVKDALVVEQFGGPDAVRGLVRPFVASGDDGYAYRSKLTPTVKRGVVGFRGATAHCAVRKCPIAHPALAQALAALSDEHASKQTRHLPLLLRVDEREGVLAAATRPHAVVEQTVLGQRFQFKANDFFQTGHRGVLDRLVLAVREAVPAGGHVVDAYCGVGLFAISLGVSALRVTGIEINRASVDFARRNAAANGIGERATFHAADANRLFDRLDDAVDDAPVTLVVDPPRAGCSSDFVRQVRTRLRPQRIVYVSCHVATQKRDVDALCAAADGDGDGAAAYRLVSLQGFDLFPQTRHVESVVVLERVEV